jgi:hypothetical protein
MLKIFHSVLRAIQQSDESTKANDFLFRRLTVDDVAESHIAALYLAVRSLMRLSGVDDSGLICSGS